MMMMMMMTYDFTF